MQHLKKIGSTLLWLAYHLLYYVIVSVCSGGIVPLWSGVAEGWVISSKRIYENRIKASRLIRKRSDILCAANKIWRLQTSVKANFKMGIRFAEFLGFKIEGLMRGYGPDKSDYIGWQSLFMSFLGNFAAAQSAKAIGEIQQRIF